MRKFAAGLNGSVEAISGAARPATIRTRAIRPAATVVFEERKLAARSLSLRRVISEGGGAGPDFVRSMSALLIVSRVSRATRRAGAGRCLHTECRRRD